MSTIIDGVCASLGERIAIERRRRGWTLAELAERSGVSRAMISNVERGDASPTANLLAKLSGAFGLTMSTLLARAEEASAAVSRVADQPRWSDPGTSYTRRSISPPDSPVELVEVELPAGARVDLPASAYSFIDQVLWTFTGVLELTMGTQVYRLEAGDCVRFGRPADCVFHNPGGLSCRYVVAINKRRERA